MNFAELIQNLIYERDNLRRRIAELEAMKAKRLVKAKKERDAARAELAKLKQQYPQELQPIIDDVEKLATEWVPSDDLHGIAERLKAVKVQQPANVQSKKHVIVVETDNASCYAHFDTESIGYLGRTALHAIGALVNHRAATLGITIEDKTNKENQNNG